MSDGQSNEYKLARMLAAFEADLPPHDLGQWHIWIEPHHVTVEDEIYTSTSRMTVGFGYAKGEARCLRCGMFFRRDFNEWVEDQANYAEAVERIKAALLDKAAKDGPCWGDVPQPPRRERGAVMDTLSQTATATAVATEKES